MFENILVPLDGSRLAEAALPIAAYFAARNNAQVTLVHVIEVHAPETVHGDRHLREPQEADEYLRRISETAFPPGTTVSYHVHSDQVRDVAESITEHTGDFKSDLVVMCTHGHGGLHHLLAGNIAQKVVTSCRSPLIVTRPEQGSAPKPFACRKILVPLDGNPEHETMLPLVTEIARTCGSTLHLQLVVPTFSTLSGKMAVTSRSLPGATSRLLDMSEEEAEVYLNELASRFAQEGLDISYGVRRGDPTGIVSETARREEIDLIALATHAKSRAEAFWSGSLTPRIIKHCTLPILLAPVEGSDTRSV